MNIDDGGTAFPVTPTDLSGQIAPTQVGMSLRDYFASAALQGLICGRSWGDDKSDSQLIKIWAKSSYIVADTMLAERAKQTTKG